ncbi:hypothetical protein GCM10023237_04730 [Streptomyces coeruleoprunus]|uniref:serine hydrolase domain-containing protein n=1 Tax=Streptomyces coeruleoprunus TaxID=285563 RepID=UPI0031E695E1
MSSPRPTTSPALRRARLVAVASTVVLALATGALPAQAAVAGPAGGTTTAAAAAVSPSGLDREALRTSLDAFHKAGMYGAYSAVRNGSEQWRGATGLADVATKRPTRPHFEHRIGSITKTFTAVAVLQQNAKGRIDLDAPIGRYLPDLVPGEEGREVTVRMLLNHTSGIPDYILPPSRACWRTRARRSTRAVTGTGSRSSWRAWASRRSRSRSAARTPTPTPTTSSPG